MAVKLGFPGIDGSSQNLAFDPLHILMHAPFLGLNFLVMLSSSFVVALGIKQKKGGGIQCTGEGY